MNAFEKLLGGGAKATISPATAVAESWNSFKIKIVLGAGGLAKKDSLGLLCGSNIDRWQFQFASNIWGQYTPFQIRDPAAPNYVTASCSRKNATISLSVGRGGPLKAFHNHPNHIIRSLKNRFRYVLEASGDVALKKGDVITLTWGDQGNGCPGVKAPPIAMRYYFLPFVYSKLPKHDRDLPFRRGEFDLMPSIRVKGKAAVRFHVTAAPFQKTGKPFGATIVAVDEYGNVDEEFAGKLKLTGRGLSMKRKSVEIKPSNKGSVSVRGLSSTQTGWRSVNVSGGGIEGESNQILVSDKPVKNQLFWGAMHGHTLDCDGILTAAEHFNYARDVARLDFAALGTHAEYFNCAEAWKNYLKAATNARSKGRFATFYGYEWAGEGHINAYFTKESEAVNIYGKNILHGQHPKDTPAFRVAKTDEQSFLRHLKSLKGQRMAISHFHARYVDPVDDEILRLHEIYSCHQQNPLETKYRDILQRGLKIGAVCGSDSHRLPVGHLCPDPDSIWNQPITIDGHVGSQSIQKQCGLQATFAPKLDEQSLWDAMWNRHTYGTTGARIVVNFEIDGAPMGTILKKKSGEKLSISLNVGGTANLAEVTIVKFDGERWREPFKKRPTGKRILDATWKDAASPNSLYFLRAVQEDGETAWTSPVWIEID